MRRFSLVVSIIFAPLFFFAFAGVALATQPVLLVPGMAGSKLYDPTLPGEDTLVWANYGEMALSDTDAFLIDSLTLSATTGESIRPIEVGDVIRNTPFGDFGPDILEGLINELEIAGYVENATSSNGLFVFPYDWRLNLDDTTGLLQSKINEIKLLTGATNVDMVAHSMGGLLVKDYISASGTADIGKLIFIGTPHLGAPKAAKVLLKGDNFGIFFLSPEAIQEIAEDSPAAYELLPNETYFENAPGYLRKYYWNSGPSTYALDREETQDYLFNEQGLNSVIDGQAETFFLQDLESTNFDGVDTYNIAGCKVNTPTSYLISPLTNNIFWTNTGKGDETVPLVSADYINIPSNHKYYYVGSKKHSELPSADGIKQGIADILTGQSVQFTNGLLDQSLDCSPRSKTMMWNGPVEVHVYGDDGAGNFTVHTGPTGDDSFDSDIPGVTYDVVGQQTTVHLPETDEQEYEISAEGTAAGLFDLRISKGELDSTTSTTIFNDVSVGSGWHVTFDISDTSSDDEITVATGSATSTVDAIATLLGDLGKDVVTPVTTSSATGTLFGGVYTSAVDVTLSATDAGAAVYRTLFSVDGGSTFQTYSTPIRIVDNGTTTIQYYSIDYAGNNETVGATNTLAVHILKPRTVALSASVHCVNGDSCQNGSVFTQVLTVTGDDHYLVADVYQNSAYCPGTVTATYDGVALTQVTSLSFAGGHWKQFELSGPSVGTHNLVVTKPSPACDFEIMAASFANVDLADPFGTRGTASGGSGGSLSTSVTGASGGLVYSAIASPNDIDVSPNSPLTTAINAAANYPGLMSATTSATGSVTASWTIASQGCCAYWAIITTPLKRVPVETTITSGPSALTASATATLYFTSAEESQIFTCTFDGGAPFSCWGSVSYSNLAIGPHTFSVYATDTAGFSDPTPATWTWNISDAVSLSASAHCGLYGPCDASSNVFTVPFTVPNEDEFLIVNAYLNTHNCAGTMTAVYDSATMTQTVSLSFSGNHWLQFELADPSQGAHNLVVTRSNGPCDFTVTAASFTGVDLSDPHGTRGTAQGASGGSISTSVTGAAGGLVYSAIMSPNKPGVTANAPLSMVIDGSLENNPAFGAVTSATGSVTTAWSISDQGCCAYWAIISTPLNPEGGEGFMGGGGGGEGESGSMFTDYDVISIEPLFDAPEASSFTESATETEMMGEPKAAKKKEKPSGVDIFGTPFYPIVTGSVTGTWMIKRP